MTLDPKPPPIAEFAAEFLSDKDTDIRIIKWNHHSNKWLACYLKWIILVISKLLVITDGRRFCNTKETDNNNNKYITHVGSHFSLGSTAQPNFSRKIFVISRILAEFFSVYAIIRLIRISAIFLQPSVFFQIANWGSTWPIVTVRFSRSTAITDLSVTRLHLPPFGCRVISLSDCKYSLNPLSQTRID